MWNFSLLQENFSEFIDKIFENQTEEPGFNIQFQDDDFLLGEFNSTNESETTQSALLNIKQKMEQIGIFDKLGNLGFNQLEINLIQEDFVSRITVTDGTLHPALEQDKYLIDIFYRCKQHFVKDFHCVQNMKHRLRQQQKPNNNNCGISTQIIHSLKPSYNLSDKSDLNREKNSSYEFLSGQMYKTSTKPSMDATEKNKNAQQKNTSNQQQQQNSNNNVSKHSNNIVPQQNQDSLLYPQKQKKTSNFTFFEQERFEWINEFFRECSGSVVKGVGVLVVEYCRSQNVTKNDSSDQGGLLPGQLHPGLGVLKQIANLVKQLASETSDLLVNYPEYWHNGYLYSNQHCFFLDPFWEAYCRAIGLALKDMIQQNSKIITQQQQNSKTMFLEAAWKVARGGVVDQVTGENIFWDKRVGEQIIPCSQRAKTAWKKQQPKYEELVGQCLSQFQFVLQD